MRAAVLCDIHGNLTAFEAVLADIRQMSPDVVLHGGDLADSGSSPVEIVDNIRYLGWRGVLGNTDEMLFRPESLEEFANCSSAPPALWAAVRQVAAATRSALGEDRLAWLRGLPMVITQDTFALVHASPASCWRAPAEEASDTDLENLYGALSHPTVVFAHTHRPLIRHMPGHPALLVNTGSVGLPFDGDPRASYLIYDADKPTIRRVEYDLERELVRLSECELPGAALTARILRTSSPQMP